MLHVTVEGARISIKEGTTLEDIAKRFQRPGTPVILLAYTGEKLRELYHTIDEDCEIRLLPTRNRADI